MSEGEFDFGGLVQRARQLSHTVQQTRDDLAALEARGSGGGGLVQATVSGENALLALAIDASVIDPDDPETLCEMVCEAVNDATRKLGAERGHRTAGLAEGFDSLLGGLRRKPERIKPVAPLRNQFDGAASAQALRRQRRNFGPSGG